MQVRMWKTGILMNCGWECKCSHNKNSMKAPQKLKAELS